MRIERRRCRHVFSSTPPTPNVGSLFVESVAIGVSVGEARIGSLLSSEEARARHVVDAQGDDHSVWNTQNTQFDLIAVSIYFEVLRISSLHIQLLL